MSSSLPPKFNFSYLHPRMVANIDCLVGCKVLTTKYRTATAVNRQVRDYVCECVVLPLLIINNLYITQTLLP